MSTGVKSQLEQIKKEIARADKLGRFVEDEDPDDPRIWIVFSHVDIPAGKFAQSNAVSDLPGHKLFLNCLDNSWYSRGVSKFSKDIPSTVSNLLALTEGLDAAYIGHSMGAYLSLICGNLHSNCRFLSTSPELSLGIRASRSFRNSVSGDVNWGLVEESGIENQNPSTGIILFGAYDPIDAYFLSDPDRIERLGTAYEVPHHHGVTEYLSANGVYTDLLGQLGDSQSFVDRLRASEFLYRINTLGSPDRYRHFYEVFVRFTEARDAYSLRAAVSAYSDWQNPGWQELRSKIFTQLCDPYLSLEAAYAAYRHQPDLMQFVETYATACANLGERRRLTQLIDSLKPAQVSHPLGKRIISRTHKRFGSLYQKRCTDGNYASLTGFAFGVKKDSEVEATASHSSEEMQALGAALVSGDYEFVLNQTEPAFHGTEGSQNSAVLFHRASALLAAGNLSASIRTLSIALKNGVSDRRQARVCIDTAVKARSSELVEAYLSLDLPVPARKKLSKRLSRATTFVTDPVLLSRIIREIALFDENSLENAFTILKDIGLAYDVCKLLPNMMVPSEVSEHGLYQVLEFFSACGMRQTAYTWLTKSDRDPPKEDRLLRLLERTAPEANDYIGSGMR